jgi:hemerythrin-like domain-containing protein
MNAINELLEEHEAVRLTLEILKRIGQDIAKTGKIANLSHLEQLFDFFSTFVDRCHHTKEEDLLFPALEDVGISRDGGPVGVMLKEHQQGRDLVARMKAVVIEYQNGDPGAAHQFNRQAQDYVTLLEYHIDKENNVLFPMAADHLPESKLAELQKGFDRIETEKVGAGKHEAFHQMLDTLEKIYM